MLLNECVCMCIQGLKADGWCGFVAYVPIHHADAVDLHSYFWSALMTTSTGIFFMVKGQGKLKSA